MKAIEATSMQLQIGADTPSRDYQIKMNLALWETCEVISKTFIPPSGAEEPDLYRDRDKLVFTSMGSTSTAGFYCLNDLIDLKVLLN